ncbi:hypothetical protein EON64_06505 [archaeon]|nr:MAG: hypothetical protein EON64_06505 [archaeon]
MTTFVQIYYIEDSTAEWISFKDECVLIAYDLVLARVSKADPFWPAILFRPTAKAEALLPGMSTYTKGGIYAEFFSDSKHREFGFVKEDCYVPVNPDNMLKKPTKRYTSAVGRMADEKCAIDEVKEV